MFLERRGLGRARWTHPRRGYLNVAFARPSYRISVSVTGDNGTLLPVPDLLGLPGMPATEPANFSFRARFAKWHLLLLLPFMVCLIIAMFSLGHAGWNLG